MKIAVAGATGLIGRMVGAQLRQAGHEVVQLSRRDGVDLTQPGAFGDALVGVDAVVDVTQGQDFDAEGTTTFFTSVARNLGQAATAAGVRRTVVLSIVGLERSADYGYYAGKLAQEKAHAAHSPGLAVLRTTQFHEFAAQQIEWGTDGEVAAVLDAQAQPIDSAEVVAALVELVTADVVKTGGIALEIGGPKEESLLDLSTRYAAYFRPDLTVVAGETPDSFRAGAMVPDAAGVEPRGIDWDTWFVRRQGEAVPPKE